MHLAKQSRNQSAIQFVGLFAAAGTLFQVIQWFVGAGSALWAICFASVFIAILVFCFYAPTLAPREFRETPKHKRVRSKMTCRCCKGSGNRWNRYTALCERCKGRGELTTYRVGQPECPSCQGTGKQHNRYEKYCKVCRGIGLLPYEEDDKG